MRSESYCGIEVLLMLSNINRIFNVSILGSIESSMFQLKGQSNLQCFNWKLYFNTNEHIIISNKS
jgi:hypothetical protein